MRPTPLFTVFIPTIGRLEYLRLAIASAQAQTYPALEILIGDEMSDDGTREFLAELAVTEPRLRFYRSEERLGMPGNWQRGLDLARGDYITILSDDDILQPEFVERCVAQFQEDSALDVVATLHEVIDETGQVDEAITSERDAFFRAQLQGRESCDLHVFPPMMSSSFRLSWARGVGFWKEATLAADVDFFRRAGAAGYRCRLLEEHLVRYRMHGGSMSSTRTAEQGRGNLQSLLRIEREFPREKETPAWKDLRHKSIYIFIQSLVRSGQVAEARRVLCDFHRWLGYRDSLKWALRVLFSPLLPRRR